MPTTAIVVVMRLLLMSVSLLIAAADAAIAEEGLVSRPQSCVATATAQLNDCSVTNVFVCKEPTGAYFRYEEYDKMGPDGVSHFTPDNRLIIAADGSGTPVFFQSIAPLTPETTLASVLANGPAPLDYDMIFSVIGISKPITFRAILAADTSVKISGNIFQRIRADVILTFPQPVGPIKGWYMLYVNDDLGIVLEGEGKMEFFNKPNESPATPASIALPGEEGFGATTPDSGCGEFSWSPVPPDARRKDNT